MLYNTTMSFFGDIETERIKSKKRNFKGSIRNYPKHTKRIPEKYYKQTELPFGKKYQTVVKVKGRDSNTGRNKTICVTIEHNKLLTRAEMDNIVRRKIRTVWKNNDSGNIEPEKIYPIEGRRNPVLT